MLSIRRAIVLSLGLLLAGCSTPAQRVEAPSSIPSDGSDAIIHGDWSDLRAAAVGAVQAVGGTCGSSSGDPRGFGCVFRTHDGRDAWISCSREDWPPELPTEPAYWGEDIDMHVLCRVEPSGDRDLEERILAEFKNRVAAMSGDERR